MNVGQLKDLLNRLPDDMPVVTKANNYELKGCCVDARSFVVEGKKVRKPFRDDFDGTNYTAEVYDLGGGSLSSDGDFEPTNEGNVLVIHG